MLLLRKIRQTLFGAKTENPPFQPAFDEVLGELKKDDDGWLVGSLDYQSATLRLSIPCIDPEFLATARGVATQLPALIERAFEFLSTFPGFGGIERVRQIFVPDDVVVDGKDGSFRLVFHCTADRDQGAAWRVHFDQWQPFSQGRDS
jgi:hypothetical protein